MIILRQKEFVDSKKNILTGTRGAEIAAGRSRKYMDRVEKVSAAAQKAGGLDKLTNKEYIDWLGKDDFRQAVEGHISSGTASSKKLDQIAKGMEASSELAADAAVRRAKTHDSVRTAQGNTVKSGDTTVNVRASQEGQAAFKRTEGVHTGNATTNVVTKATEGRRQKMKNIQDRGVVAKEYVPANMTVGKGRESHNRHAPKAKPGKINTTTNPGITFTDAPKNTTTVTNTTPNRTVSVSTGMQQAQGSSTPTRVTTVNTVNNKPVSTSKTPKVEIPKAAASTTNIPQQPNTTGNGNFFKNIWNTTGGKAAIIGTGLLTTAYGVHKIRKNRRKRKEEEEERYRDRYRY